MANYIKRYRAVIREASRQNPLTNRVDYFCVVIWYDNMGTVTESTEFPNREQAQKWLEDPVGPSVKRNVHHSGAILKRDRFWRIQWYDEFGKNTTLSQGFNTPDEAEKEYDRIRKAHLIRINADNGLGRRRPDPKEGLAGVAPNMQKEYHRIFKEAVKAHDKKDFDACDRWLAALRNLMPRNSLLSDVAEYAHRQDVLIAYANRKYPANTGTPARSGRELRDLTAREYVHSAMSSTERSRARTRKPGRVADFDEKWNAGIKRWFPEAAV